MYFKNPDILAEAMRPQDRLLPQWSSSHTVLIDGSGPRGSSEGDRRRERVPLGDCEGRVRDGGSGGHGEDQKADGGPIYDGTEQVDLTDFALEQRVILVGKRPILMSLS